MTKIIWTSNEQGAFDFDYLLNLTSQDFVNDIKRDIDDCISFSSVKIEEFSNNVISYVVDGSVVRIRNYDKETGKISFNLLSYFDIEWIWSAMDGKR
ncbi:hypothetical protein ABD91_17295 [Lysinibacillus sphaericus]|uniref:hypothetical protein n=1 Tax=Lysinibacillus sphaericus TaxID=1421 RepID=UPI0018CDAF60|nr:hypothetical protein [Lysinibacillus sphaericus]MBG9692549.1 hypothetical protein [Lysinibacillus sphaericus]